MAHRWSTALLISCSFYRSLLAADETAVVAGRTGASSASQSTDEPLAGKANARPRGQNPRVLFIVSKDCPECDRELARLRRPGADFDKLCARGWKIGPAAENHLQIVDRDAIPDLIEQFKPEHFPTVACLDQSEIVRSFHSGCTTPLDMWTFAWLAKGIDERPAASILEAARAETTNHYPLRGNHWSIDEDWNPSRDKVISHLRGPNHGHQIASRAIETWSYEELRSLHDNLHEQEMGGVSYASRSQPANPFSATRKITGH